MATAILNYARPHVLKNDGEHEAAIAEIEQLVDEDVEAGRIWMR